MRPGTRMSYGQTIHKVVFISPTASQPRYHKRVAQLAKLCDVVVFAFRRGYYEENTFPASVPFTSLGWISDGKYFRRLFSMIAAVVKIKAHLRDMTDCIFYAMSLDCMIIAKLCGLKNGYYEVGDLRQAEGFGKVTAFLENWFLRNILGLVLTSRYFYDHFYESKKVVSKEKVYFIDNKVNQELSGKRPLNKKFSQARIVIGLIGLLRYRRPVELLLQFAKERPDSYIVECFGDGPLRGLVESYICENIRYYGSFKNPDDLPNIYAQIDLNYVVYDYLNKNARLAIPNKLFESAYFGVPIVCCQGTSVGKMAVEWQIGKMVRIDGSEHFEEDFSSIDRKWLRHCSENCFKLPGSVLLDNGEEVLHKMLADVIEA